MSWRGEVGALVRKEWLADRRDLGATLAPGVFALGTVVAISVAAFNTQLRGGVAAGLLWTALLFTALVGQPRRFLQEEESGTGDLLRLFARPHAVFWAKAIVGVAEMALTAATLSLLFFGLTSATLVRPGLYALGMAGSVLALTGAASLAGALAAGGTNRATLAATVALPLLVPVIFFGVAALRVALGEGGAEGGWTAGWGLLGYGIASVTLGPWVFAATWRR